MKLRFIISLLALTLSFSQLSAQRKNKAYLDYIEKYSSLAVKHQKQYGIPASITLAQGLLESGAGRSELARMSNNHFGIKCHSDWKGKRVYEATPVREQLHCFSGVIRERISRIF